MLYVLQLDVRTLKFLTNFDVNLTALLGRRELKVEHFIVPLFTAIMLAMLKIASYGKIY